MVKVAQTHPVVVQMVERSRAVGVAQRQLLRTSGSKTDTLLKQERVKVGVGAVGGVFMVKECICIILNVYLHLWHQNEDVLTPCSMPTYYSLEYYMISIEDIYSSSLIDNKYYFKCTFE